MNKNKFYTAVGRFERRDTCRSSCPVIVIGGQDHMVDMQELMLWLTLNWRFLRPHELEAAFEESSLKNGGIFGRTCQECTDRLMMRGLIVSGSGDTEYDALYDLLGSLFIIPADGSFYLRMTTFIKMMLSKKIAVTSAKKLFQSDARSDKEKQVMKLARQAMLSTAEIIKCVENNIKWLPNQESILDHLYSDNETTSDNISFTARLSTVSKPVTLAVANLYLRQQIIFSRV